jgi:hypothetical protein
MPTAAYIILAGLNFEQPGHPGPLPVHPGNATSAQITAANSRTYDAELTDFNTCIKVKEEVKQQILAAVDNIYLQNLEDDVFGYADVTIQNILAHLNTNYGTLEPSDLEANQNKLDEQWNPNDPFKNFWIRVKRIRAVATAGANPIQDGQPSNCPSLHFEKLESTTAMPSQLGKTRRPRNKPGKTSKRISTITKKRESNVLLRKLQDITEPITAKRSLPTITRRHQNSLLCSKTSPAGGKANQNFECDDIKL